MKLREFFGYIHSRNTRAELVIQVPNITCPSGQMLLHLSRYSLQLFHYIFNKNSESFGSQDGYEIRFLNFSGKKSLAN